MLNYKIMAFCFYNINYLVFVRKLIKLQKTPVIVVNDERAKSKMISGAIS